MTTAKPKPNRVASAIVLIRRTDGSGLQVFLAERAPQLRFFGGYHAFIGGVREPIDGVDAAGGDDRAAMRACAVRELFEETGILADPDLRESSDPTRLAKVREQLLDRDAESTDWVELLEHSRGASELREFCRITTPPFAPVRYATAFFVMEVPESVEPDIVSGELTHGRWWRPEQALAAWHRGEVEIVPPALILLECLEAGDVDAFCREAKVRTDRYAAGDLHHVRFSPGILLAPLTTPTIPPATTTNCLLVGTDTIYVVDPASPDESEQARLFAMCDELIEGGARIAGVLSTHHHPDHVGAIAATCERYDVPVRGHALTLDRLPPDCRLGEPLADGDRIDLGTAPDGSEHWTLEAIHTPGHDRGHLCFHESRYAALIAGDMVSTISTIMIDPPEGHMGTYIASLEKLATLDVGTLYPAHGPAVRNGTRVLKKFIEHRATRERALVAALDEVPRSVDSLVPIVYADTDSRMYPYAARSLLAGLEKLEAEGVAQQRDGGWVSSSA